MNNSDDVLKSILYELKLLTASIKSESLNKFYNEFLTTAQLISIYEAVDGILDIKGINEKVGCSERYVQKFIKELTEKDLISTAKQGNRTIPNKDSNKIALHYANIRANIRAEDEKIE